MRPPSHSNGLSLLPLTRYLANWAFITWGINCCRNRLRNSFSTVPSHLTFPLTKVKFLIRRMILDWQSLPAGSTREPPSPPSMRRSLASAVVNDGVMMKPWIVKRVINGEGQVLYENHESKMGVSVSPETAKALRVLMKDTVIHGTCRKAFFRERRRKVYKNVELGAKTGTINDRTDEFKYDWLTAYVVPPDGRKEISIAVLGIHGKMLGVRANRLGRSIIRYYLSS